MKTDRLLSIVIYLLNHHIVTAAKLADRFEVSKRTILRDIEHISMAGIPIQSHPGAKGGYSIMEGYKLDGRLVNAEDSAAIIAALKGLLSAYDGGRYNEVLEKISSILPQNQSQKVFLDFGASGEDDALQERLRHLENAIANKNAVEIAYVNAVGDISTRLVEPIALNYRWYAWYLLAFCIQKQDYRIFKVVRISKLNPTTISFSKAHENASTLLEQAFQHGGQKSLDIVLRCKSEIKVQICEYLNGKIAEVLDNGDFIMHLHVLEDERMWFAMLLSFGNKVTVVEPVSLKMRLTKTAENILSLYQQQ
ncbi:MAG: YafY family transcriptional regulator [Defluviitaleaceae bacterium]|nr:YafY family transcriptional regulator [Defluviitaleaceae bacterium]